MFLSAQEKHAASQLGSIYLGVSVSLYKRLLRSTIGKAQGGGGLDRRYQLPKHPPRALLMTHR